MKHSRLCPHVLMVAGGIFALVFSFALAFGANNQPGGKAVKADLVALVGGLKKLVESESFQEDLKSFVKDQLEEIELKDEQLKDVQQLLSLFQKYLALDQEQLAQEQKDYFAQLAEVNMQRYKDPEYIKAVQEGLPYEMPNSEELVEKSELLVQADKLRQEIMDKVEPNALDEALSEIFGGASLEERNTRILAITSKLYNAMIEAGLEVVQEKLAPEDDDTGEVND